MAATFVEAKWSDYALGFQFPGKSAEVFNSHVYNNWVNRWVVGNSGAIEAAGGPLHGFSTSPSIAIPSNAVVVFGRLWPNSVPKPHWL